MNVCIDTNAYSCLAEHKPETWNLISRAEKIFIPSIVLGELYAGFECGTKFNQNSLTLKNFLQLPGVETVPIEHLHACRYGVIFKQLRTAGKMIPTNDIWIAATAMETGARLVTYDLHFNHVPGLIVLSP